MFTRFRDVCGDSRRKRNKRGLWLPFVFLLLLTPTFYVQAAEVRIGVLTLRGQEKVAEAWVEMIRYLNETLPTHRFELVPLDFDQVTLSARQRSVDFIIANSSFYVELERTYGASAVATLYHRDANGVAISRFGGVVLTQAQRGHIRQLGDLKGKRVAAVAPTSFGGWQTGLRELQQQGYKPEMFARLDFLGTHDAVVQAVAAGTHDAGFVRTGTLEQMAQEGSIHPGEFFILAEKHESGFPQRLSTRLYPEWPLARLPGVSETLAVQLAVALMQMPEEYMLFHSPYGAGWTLPQNYQPVHELLRELRLGPYEYLNDWTLEQVLTAYWHYLLLALLLLFSAVVSVLYFVQMNRRLQQQQHALTQLNNELEARVDERTQRVQGLLEAEQYLRSIVQTVADVNQIIITAEQCTDMLKSACDRLVSHPEYGFAWVAVEQDGQVQRLVNSYGSSEQLQQLMLAPAALVAVMEAMRKNRLHLLDEERLQVMAVGVESINAAALLPLRANAYTDAIGVLCVYTRRRAGFEAEEISMLEQLAGDLGFAMHAFLRREQSERMEAARIRNYEETILAMVDMIEKRDTYTAGHTRRVADYSRRIAHALGLDDEAIEQLVKAATLHDIGKIIIPDAVLLKPGALTSLEYELIKQHVSVGYETLSGVAMYQDLAELMRHHHERMDGSGYPQGLVGEQIPLSARIMAVADSFDAMTSNRIYKPRKSVEEALQELQALADVHYDRSVVEAACQVLADLPAVSDADQLPTTDIERQRFAYFFNDQLTGLYNAEYLQFMLQRNLHVHFHSLQMILLRGFAAYNETHGWHRGNHLLRDFAHWLQHKCPGGMVFRVLGDDFVLINAPDGWLVEGEMEQHSPLTGTQVSAEQLRFGLDEGSLQHLQQVLSGALGSH